jgi:catechol 2,3-dioxygenase-like lactoylglutathione lyase family enzyme
MENIIASLLNRYDNGTLGRRELMQGLALLVATAGQSKAAGFEGTHINHVSLSVSDLQRSSQFYQKIFGMTVRDQSADKVRLNIGKSYISLQRKDRGAVVDHFGIGVEHWNAQAVTEDLKRRGADPMNGGDANGVWVLDPDKYPVQLIGDEV